MIFRALLIWFVLLGLAIANGSARVALLIPRFGEQAGHVMSTVIFCGLIVLVTRLTIRWIGPESPGDAVRIGAGWTAMTVAFEFLGGHYLFGQPWSKLVADYNLLDGRVWVLVLVVTCLAPILVFRRPSAHHPGRTSP